METIDGNTFTDLVTGGVAPTVVTAEVPIDMLKSEHDPIPQDAHWITAHQNGVGSKGQPVLVVPVGQNGALRVIGGAGGKLNTLEFRGVRSDGEYRQEAAERSKAKRQEH